MGIFYSKKTIILYIILSIFNVIGLLFGTPQFFLGLIMYSGRQLLMIIVIESMELLLFIVLFELHLNLNNRPYKCIKRVDQAMIYCTSPSKKGVNKRAKLIVYKAILERVTGKPISSCEIIEQFLARGDTKLSKPMELHLLINLCKGKIAAKNAEGVSSIFENMQIIMNEKTVKKVKKSERFSEQMEEIEYILAVESGNYEEAIPYFERVINSDAKKIDRTYANYWLGTIYEKLNDEEKELEYFKNVIEMGNDLAIVSEVKAKISVQPLEKTNNAVKALPMD